MVAKRTRSGSVGTTAAEASSACHSSVTTTVTVRALSAAASWRHTTSMGLMWPRPGYGTATTCRAGAAAAAVAISW
jgi:hypothetical protein